MKKQFTILLILVFVFGLIPVNFSLAITQNQINAEVQIVCPDNYGNWFSGSGTIIDPKGIILTNKHVVTDEDGGIIKTCAVGFVELINKEPNFYTNGEVNTAEVKYYTTTKGMDAAILYLDNSTNKTYPSVDIWNSNSDTLKFGDKVEVIGFPSIGGSTITYTSGDFSGFGSSSDGTQNYIKASVPLEHGNSGGAAYNSDGEFIGVPSMVISGGVGYLSYILSINSIKSWLNNTLGFNYQKEVQDYNVDVDNSVENINIQNDKTPPQKAVGLHVSCYSDESRTSWVWIGPTYIDSKPTQFNISKIYCDWTDFEDPSGMAGYYVYFGENINANPVEEGSFVQTPNIVATFNQKGRYRFIIQAKDRVGNISQPVDFGAYHYLMLDEDKIWKETVTKKITENKINRFYIYDYSNGYKGNLLKVIPYNQKQILDYPVPSNNLLIEWDGMADRNFVTKLQVKFNGDDFQVLNNNYIARTNLNINNKVVFTLEAHYTESPDVDYQWINSKLFSITPTVAKRFTPSNFADRLKGKLLLQVEDRGRIWYVNPDDAQKHEVTFANALPLFQKFALGITNKDLNSIPLNNENGASSIGNRLKGKLLLQVEDKGRIWYVDFNGKKWEVTWANLMNLFQKLALGITNADLEKIQEGSLE